MPKHATVSLYEAKTQLSHLVDRVSRGDEVVTTRHGRPVVRRWGSSIVICCKVLHIASMAKDAAITVRLPVAVKQRLEAQARRERRSLSAQVATCLTRSVEDEPAPTAGKRGKLLGLYAGARVPTDRDFVEARRLLWGSLGRPRRGA